MNNVRQVEIQLHVSERSGFSSRVWCRETYMYRCGHGLHCAVHGLPEMASVLA